MSGTESLDPYEFHYYLHNYQYQFTHSPPGPSKDSHSSLLALTANNTLGMLCTLVFANLICTDHDDHTIVSLPPEHPVFIGLEIIDVDRINDAENFFSLQLHLFELWREPRLNTSALNIFWANENDAEGSADHHNDDPIPVNEANIADCLWTPSLVFEDSTEKESLLPPTSILLAYKNNVLARNSR